MTNIEIISLPRPNVIHILSSEKKSEEYSAVKYYWEFKGEYSPIIESHSGEILNIKINKGFVSDGGTIPRLFGYFDNLAFRSYLVHDFLYKNKMFTRKECDLILKECLKFEGVSVIDRNIIYIAVRLFGKNHYG